MWHMTITMPLLECCVVPLVWAICVQHLTTLASAIPEMYGAQKKDHVM